MFINQALQISIVGLCLCCGANAALSQPLGLETVIVTGTNTDHSQIKAEGVDGALVHNNTVRSSADIADLVSDVQIALPNGNANQPFVSIRGIAPVDADNNNTGPVAMFVDGIYLSAASSQTFPTFDLQRIDIFKGPQTTSFAQGAIGGAINFVSAQPQAAFASSFNASYGSFNSQQFVGMVTGPLSESTRARFSFVRNSASGYVLNTLNGTHENGTGNLAARVLVDSNLTEDFKLQVALRGFLVDQKPTVPKHFGTFSNPVTQSGCSEAAIEAEACVDAFGYGVPTGAPAGSFQGQYNDLGHFKMSDFGGTVGLTDDLGSVALHATATVELNRKTAPNEEDGSPYRLLEILSNAHSATFLSNLGAQGQAGRVHWSAGASFLGESLTQNVLLNVLNDYDKVVGVASAGDGIAIKGGYNNLQKTTSYALYGNAIIDLAPQWQLTLGGRATDVTKGFRNAEFLALQSGGEGNFAPPTPIGSGNRSAYATNISGQVALAYQMDSNARVYADVSSGFEGPVFNGGTYGATLADFNVQSLPTKSMTVIAYEAGAFFEALDRTLKLRSTVFLDDYRNLQLSNQIAAPAGEPFFLNVLDNARSARTQGVELSATGTVAEKLDLRVAATYLDTKIGSYLSGGGLRSAQDLTGHQLPQAPHLSVIVGGGYWVPFSDGSKLSLSANAAFRSRQYFNLTNDALLSQSGYWQVDARLSYAPAGEMWDIAVFSKNLTDTTSFGYGFDVRTSFGLIEKYWNAPRSVGVELGMRTN